MSCALCGLVLGTTQPYKHTSLDIFQSHFDHSLDGGVKVELDRNKSWESCERSHVATMLHLIVWRCSLIMYTLNGTAEVSRHERVVRLNICTGKNPDPYREVNSPFPELHLRRPDSLAFHR